MATPRNPLYGSLPKPKAKFRNVKQKVEGITFDSKGELKHWHDLCVRQSIGEISDLKRQVRFVLCPPVKLLGEERASAVTYVADYQYVENGMTIVADFKGVDTPASRIKRRLMKWINGIDVLIVRSTKARKSLPQRRECV